MEFKETKPKAKIFIDGETVCVETPYFSKDVNIYFAANEGFAWVKERGRREMPLALVTPVHEKMIEFIPHKFKNFEWVISESDMVKIKASALEPKAPPLNPFEGVVTLTDRIKEIKDGKNLSISDFASFLKVEPKPFQKIGIEFIEANNGVAMIGDEMGLGKTLQAFGYAAKHHYKTVVVTLSSVKAPHKDEVEKLTYKRAVVVSDLKPGELKNAFAEYDFFIINYQQLGKYLKDFQKVCFDCVICDESQMMSNMKAARTRNVFKAFSSIPRRILLSGTPMGNTSMELYAQLHFLRPDIFKNARDFGERFCAPEMTYWGKAYKGSSNEKELKALMSGFYLARIKKEVAKMPEKKTRTIKLKLEGDDLRQYQLLKGDAAKKFIEEYGAAPNEIPDYLLENDKTMAVLHKLKAYCSLMKVNFIRPLVRDLLKADPTRKIIVFSGVRKTQSVLPDVFSDIGHVFLYGDNTQKERSEAQKKFKEDPDVRLFLVSTKAGGTGLNLPEADTVIFNDIEWEPRSLLQAEDRAHRLTQKKEVNVYYPIFVNTVEEYISDTVESKAELIRRVLGKED